MYVVWTANHDQVITSAIRGFSGGELVSLIQFRPSMALLGLLYHRLSTVDDPYIGLRKCVTTSGSVHLSIPSLETRSSK